MILTINCNYSRNWFAFVIETAGVYHVAGTKLLYVYKNLWHRFDPCLVYLSFVADKVTVRQGL